MATRNTGFGGGPNFPSISESINLSEGRSNVHFIRPGSFPYGSRTKGAGQNAPTPAGLIYLIRIFISPGTSLSLRPYSLLLPSPNSFSALANIRWEKTHGNGSSINSPSTSPVYIICMYVRTYTHTRTPTPQNTSKTLITGPKVFFPLYRRRFSLFSLYSLPVNKLPRLYCLGHNVSELIKQRHFSAISTMPNVFACISFPHIIPTVPLTLIACYREARGYYFNYSGAPSSVRTHRPTIIHPSGLLRVLRTIAFTRPISKTNFDLSSPKTLARAHTHFTSVAVFLLLLLFSF